MEDGDARRELLTYVFVGAGYAGLEALAELQDFTADVMDLYPRCRSPGCAWILVEATERVMPEIGPKLAEFAVRELRGRGIEIRTSTTLDAVTASTATLSDGEVVHTRTVVWTAGVKPHPVLARFGLPLDDRGRIISDSHLQVQGFDNVWALGDCAAVPDPARKGQPCPPTAQHAIRQGRVVARKRRCGARGRRPAAAVHVQDEGRLRRMGRRKAVATTGPITWSGMPAWMLARQLPTSPRCRGPAAVPGCSSTGTSALLFGRDTAELGSLGTPLSLADETSAETTNGAVPYVPAPDSLKI